MILAAVPGIVFALVVGGSIIAGLIYCNNNPDYCSDSGSKIAMCGYEGLNESIPTLGLATADVKNGNTDHKILARIYYGEDSATGQWSDWHAVDNIGCNDRERGQLDFYDDFRDIEERWLAVALYNCGTDGFALDGILYWNGTHFRENLIDLFCGNVAGPMVECYQEAYDPAVTGAYCFEGDPTANYYDHVWIDQNNAACPGVLIGTGKTLKGNSSEEVGRMYPKADPGRPHCGSYTSTNSRMFPGFDPNRNPPHGDPANDYKRYPQPVSHPHDDVYYEPTETVTITTTMMNAIIVAVGILVCMNVAMVVNMWRNSKRGVGAVKYAKVAYVDESSA